MNSIIKLWLGKRAIKLSMEIVMFKFYEGQMGIFLIPFVHLYETKINIVNQLMSSIFIRSRKIKGKK